MREIRKKILRVPYAYLTRDLTRILRKSNAHPTRHPTHIQRTSNAILTHPVRVLTISQLILRISTNRVRSRPIFLLGGYARHCTRLAGSVKLTHINQIHAHAEQGIKPNPVHIPNPVVVLLKHCGNSLCAAHLFPRLPCPPRPPRPASSAAPSSAAGSSPPTTSIVPWLSSARKSCAIAPPCRCTWMSA